MEHTNLRDIIKNQQSTLKSLEKEIDALEKSDFLRENVALKADLEELQAKYYVMKRKNDELLLENIALSSAIRDGYYREKVDIVINSKQKAELYFGRTAGAEVNRLLYLERGIIARLNNLAKSINEHHSELSAKYTEKLYTIQKELDEDMRQVLVERKALLDSEQSEYAAIQEAELSDEDIKKIASRNNLERFLGLNIFNTLGILLIIIGAFAAAQFAFVRIGVYAQSMMIFALGLVMLGVGEFLNRRRKANVFSLGLTAGGIAVLYVALGVSYILFGIFTMPVALALCIAITAMSFCLSMRYNGHIILALGLFGGNMPILSLIEMPNMSTNLVAGLMLYLLILNASSLLISFKKKWKIAVFLGAGLNIMAVFLVNGIAHYGTMHFAFTALSFLNYGIIPIASNYKLKIPFASSDILVLSATIIAALLSTAHLIAWFNMQNIAGAVMLVFCAIMLSFGYSVSRLFENERHIESMFYIFAASFFALFIPLQLELQWISLGWLTQGILLSVYGILKDRGGFRKTGLVIYTLCIFALLLIDVGLYQQANHFHLRYLGITLGGLIIMGAHIYKDRKYGGFLKYAAIANLWLFGVYSMFQLENILQNTHPYSVHQFGFLVGSLIIAYTFIYAYAISRINFLKDSTIDGMSFALYVLGILSYFAMNQFTRAIEDYMPIGAILLGTITIFLLNVVVLLTVYHLLKILIERDYMGAQWLPVALAIFFISTLTQNLIMHYGLAFSSFWLSIIYAATALGLIVVGFVRRFANARKCGLALALFAVIKLFVIDLATLSLGFRIISYFSLGIAMVGISFVYQYFNKRLEIKLRKE